MSLLLSDCMPRKVKYQHSCNIYWK